MLIVWRGLNIYGSKLLKIPTPKYIVFYNGERNRPSVEKLKLSDAFMHKVEDYEFEWTATMINLNEGKNEEILSKCRVLSDYMTLINKIRNYKRKTSKMRDAIELAINECIEEGVLKEFLEKHRGEVMASCLTEFDEQAFIRGIHEEGREEGREEAIIEIAQNLLDILSDEEISIRLKLPLDTVQQIRKENE